MNVSRLTLCLISDSPDPVSLETMSGFHSRLPRHKHPLRSRINDSEDSILTRFFSGSKICLLNILREPQKYHSAKILLVTLLDISFSVRQQLCGSQGGRGRRTENRAVMIWTVICYFGSKCDTKKESLGTRRSPNPCAYHCRLITFFGVYASTFRSNMSNPLRVVTARQPGLLLLLLSSFSFLA